MKVTFHPDDWLLQPKEMELLTNRTPGGRLGFAILLRYFQVKGRFPEHLREIPPDGMRRVAEQLGVAQEASVDLDWEGRTFKRHRAEIREYCGFREFTIPDVEAFRVWLIEKAIPQEHRPDRLLGAFLQRCLDLQIEPPTQAQTDRLVQSALHAHEERFCDVVFQSLGGEVVERLEALLAVVAGPLEEEPDRTPWNMIKGEPGKAGVAHMREAISRLRRVREVGLPVDLFTGIRPKLLESYAQRAAVEEPHELRRHRPPLRATLLAAYLYRRSETLTDHLVDLLIETFHKMAKNAEKRVALELVGTAQLVRGKVQVIRRVAQAVVGDTEGVSPTKVRKVPQDFGQPLGVKDFRQLRNSQSGARFSR